MRRKSVLIIAGSDSSAGAGVQADIKTFSAFNVYAATVFTALTAQNTKGVNAVFNVPLKFIENQIKSVAEDLNVSFIKIGMLSNENIIKTVDNCLKKYLPNIPIVLDPVMVAKGGHELLNKKSVSALKRNLLTKSFIITPNLLEAEKILNYKIKNFNNMENCLEKFLSLGISNVLLKGGHMRNHNTIVTDLLFSNGKIYKFTSKRIKTKNTHGTGCSLASAITANLFLGKNIVDSIKISRSFVNKAIRMNFEVGRGHNPINHFINFKS